MGKGGGGGTTQSTGTTYTTNLPEYAQPYVETMLGATQKQLFQTQPGFGGTTEITGFQPYTPYSTDPSKSIAGFSPLQQQAQQNIAGMQTPGAYGQAQGLAGMSGMGQFGTAQQANMMGAMPAFGAGQQFTQGITDPTTMGSFMSPYQQQVTDIAKADAVRNAQIAGNQANLGAARQGTYGGARQALAGSERERNLLSNLSSIQAKGSQEAYDKAMEAQQFGATLGLQGIQTGLQGIQAGQQGVAQGLAGVGAQQAGYSGAGQAASTMGSLAGQEFGTRKNIIEMQQKAGTEQQQQQQQIINQAIQDYANAQQYPMMQLGFMSNMLRGLPMQSTNTQQYTAAPNQLTQGIGALGAGANIYSAFQGNSTKVAEGGQIKSYAKGGITSYSAGERVKADLANIKDAEELKEIAKNTSSDMIRRDALRFAKMRELGLAGGGIVAFADGKTVYGQSNKTREDFIIPDSDELKARREADIAAALALKAERDANPLVAAPAVAPAAAAPSAGITQVAPSGGRFSAQGAGTPRVDLSRFKAAEDTGTRTAADVRAGKGIPLAIKEDVKEKVLAPVVEDAARNDRGETKAEQISMAEKKDEAPVAAKREAPAKGITEVTPSTEGISKNRANIPGLSPTMQALYDRSTGRQQTLEEILAEQQAMKEKYVGPDTRPEERARLMAEKSNLAEEARRREKLQIAQFFASWGSTPGSTLQAAMVAVNKNIPNLIESQKEARKAQGEVDKIIRELNKAERLEKEGDLDGAYKIKTEQSKKYEDLNKTLMTYVGQKEAAATKATGSDKVTQQKMLFMAQDQLGKARRALTDLPSKNKELYRDANSPVLEKESKILTDKRNAAKAKIAEIEAEQRAQIEEAENTLEALRKQGDIVVPAKKDTQVASAAPGTAANPIKIK
jgi:hypothetical protein